MSEAWKRNLAVPFFTQRDNTYIWQRKDEEGKVWIDDDGKEGLKYPMAWRTCNITSLCMILHYWGITDKTPNQMIEEVYSNTEWNWSASVTGYKALVYWANLRKIAGHYTQNYKDGNGNPIYKIIGGKEKENNFTLEFAREQIAKGAPVMLSTGLVSVINDYNTYKGDGHIVVIRGFTNDGDVILNDPYGIPVDNAGMIKPLTGEAKGQDKGTIIAGYYYNSPAASVGDNIVIKKAEFNKICKGTGIRYITIEGPLWQQPCDPMTEPDSENSYPIKTNNYWHDGIHLQSAEGFRSIGSGRLVAARNADVMGDDGKVHGSGSFALVRYPLPSKESQFFYALYMHLKTVDLKSELEEFMKNGFVSEPLRGTWYEQIFDNLLPRYKIFNFSLPENFSGENYNAIYEAKIIKEGKGVKIVKTDKFVNFENSPNNTGTLSKNMKAYLLPVEKFQTICDIDSYSSIENLKFMVAKDDKDFIFKHNKQDYYVFYCGNGRGGRKLCCCKTSFFANYDIYNGASYSYYVKKLYSLYKGEVVSFPEIKSDSTFQEIKSDTKDYITTSSILAKDLVDCKSDMLEYGFSLGDKIVGITDSYSRIKSDAEQLACDIVQLLDLCSNTGDKKISKSFEQMMQNYVKERKKQIENLLYNITKKIDGKNEPLNSFRSSIKTDKEWMLAFYQDAEKKLNVKEILGIEGSYVPEGNDINGVEYNNIRKPFEGILDKYKEYDVLSVVAICEYLMIKFVAIPQKNVAGGKDYRFVYRESDKSKTITSLFKIWEESLTSEQSLKSIYKDFFKERYIDNFIEISKGAKIGYGSKIPESKTADSIHFEIFSGENLLKDSEELVVDFEDKDNFYTPKEITKAIFDTNCLTEEYKKINPGRVKNCLLTSDDIKKIYTEESAFQRLISCHISEWEKLNYRKESLKSMFNIKKENQRKEKVDLKEYFEEIYNKYCWFNKNLLNKDDKKITDKLYFYHPSYFIDKLFTEGSFASLSEKTEEATIQQIDFVDEKENPIKNDINLFVNLEKNTCMSKDNINDSIRCRIKFSQQGNFKYSIRLNKIKSMVDYSESEKKYFSTILYTDKKVEFTGSQDSTINITDFFSFGQIGGVEFKIEAEYNGKTVETDYTVTVWRLLYLNVFNSAGLYINMDNIKKTFEKYYLKLEVLNQKTVEIKSILSYSSNGVYPSEIESFIKAQIDKLFDNSFILNLFLVKNIMNTNFFQYEISNPSNIVELNLFNKRWLLSSYPEEDWFYYGYYIDIEGQLFYLKKENFTVLKYKNLLYGLRINLSGSLQEVSTVKLNLKLITDIKSGLSFAGKNYVALATEILGEKLAMLDIEHTCIHEIGHKLGLVSDGTNGLDKGLYHYSGRGHLGNHCHYGTNLVDNFENGDSRANSKCIMFGTTNKSTDFCESCGNTLIKGDFSNGINRKIR